MVVLPAVVAIHADEFKGQLGAEYFNTMISTLVLPEPVSPQPDTPPTAPAQVTSENVSGSCSCTCSHPCATDGLRKHSETTQGNDGSDQTPGIFKEPERDVYESETPETGHQSAESTTGDTERGCQVR